MKKLRTLLSLIIVVLGKKCGGKEGERGLTNGIREKFLINLNRSNVLLGEFSYNN